MVLFDRFTHATGFTICSFTSIVSDTQSTKCEALPENSFTLSPFDNTAITCSDKEVPIEYKAKRDFICSFIELGQNWWYISTMSVLAVTSTFFCVTCCCYSFCRVRTSKQQVDLIRINTQMRRARQ